MKKFGFTILLLCMVLALAACTDHGSTTPENTTPENTAYEITMQEIYDANQTEDLRKITVVSNPGAEKEVSQDFQIPKGLIVGFTYGDDFVDQVEFYTDAACTETFDPYTDTESDLTVYVKWAE